MGSYWSYCLAAELSRRLPLPAAYGLAQRLADGAFARRLAAREAVCANLSALLGGAPPTHVAAAREVFRNFGRYLVEVFRLPGDGDAAVAIDGREHLEAAAHRGRGVIVLTAHLGNWELGACVLSRLGAGVCAVALPHEDPRMDKLINRQRRRCGVEAIPMGRAAPRMILARLQEGRVLGVLGDWDLAGDGIARPFGRGRMVFPRGPAVLSLRSGAPIVPSLIVREGLGAFRLRCEPPLSPQRSGEAGTSIERLVGAYADRIGAWVQQHPEQWLMFHPIVSVR